MLCAIYSFLLLFSDFRERNATVARKWAELTEDERKIWASKAEAVCSSSVQVYRQAVLLGHLLRLLYRDLLVPCYDCMHM